jgi:hypothetical protein
MLGRILEMILMYKMAFQAGNFGPMVQGKDLADMMGHRHVLMTARL